MSLVITLYVREGIVMASDSRLTLNAMQTTPAGGQVVQLAVGQSDSNYKTFLTPNDVGISTFGAAEISGVPIGGFVESFMNDNVVPGNLVVDQVAAQILQYFRTMNPIPDTHFIVAGYKQVGNSKEQQVWAVAVSANTCTQVNIQGEQGARWGGETDILSRLLQPVGTVNAAGALEATLPHHGVPWQFFTLQDAIDFAMFAIRSTIDAIRFQPRAKTVGGPIDVLVIKPTGSEWIRRKELAVTP